MRDVACIRDLGEFRFLAEVVAPSLWLEGESPEDAAVVAASSCDLVVTVDRGNLPVLFLLGERNWRVCGWHLVAATLSDLAAVGARPVSFSSSVVFPGDFEVDDARRFFEGIRSACERFEIKLAGGNVAEGKDYSAHGFAVGEVPSGSAIRRCGCQPGDAILLLGDGGLFMSGFVTADRKGLHTVGTRQQKSLSEPVPKLAVMRGLRKRGLVRAASDDSDGVLGAVWNVASASGLAVDLFEDRIEWPSYVLAAAELGELDRRAIFFSWGGLQIAAAVRPGDVSEVEAICRKHSVGLYQLGVAVEGPPRITWTAGSQKEELEIVRNEAFRSTLYTGVGTSAVWTYLRTPLQSQPVPL